MNRTVFLLLSSCLTLTFAAGCTAAPEGIPSMTEDAFLLDVRSVSEYRAGHLSGAVLVPHDHVEKSIRAIVPEKNAPVYLYCRSGRRSALARETMNRLGYEKVYDLGSLEAAQKFLDRPVVR